MKTSNPSGLVSNENTLSLFMNCRHHMSMSNEPLNTSAPARADNKPLELNCSLFGKLKHY